jgi:hypothetical protein
LNLTSLAQLDGDLQPQTLICQDCGAPFTFWVEEQNYFRGCSTRRPSGFHPCRERRKQERKAWAEGKP